MGGRPDELGLARLDMPAWLDDLFNFQWPTFSWPSWLPGGPPTDGQGQLGITYAHGGAYLVGEAGREIVDLPAGLPSSPTGRRRTFWPVRAAASM